MICVIVNSISMVFLVVSLHYAMRMRRLTCHVSSAWLLLSVGILFLILYSITNIIEFSDEELYLFGENPGFLGSDLGEAMDMTELALVPAAVAFLAAAFLELRTSVVKPI